MVRVSLQEMNVSICSVPKSDGNQTYVCFCFSKCGLDYRERERDTDNKLGQERERKRERRLIKRSRKPDQTWAQVTHRGYPVSIATGRCKTLGANLAFDLLR